MAIKDTTLDFKNARLNFGTHRVSSYFDGSVTDITDIDLGEAKEHQDALESKSPRLGPDVTNTD